METQMAVRIKLDSEEIAEFVRAIEKIRLANINLPPRCRCRLVPIKLVDTGLLMPSILPESLKGKTDRTDRTNE